MKRPDDNDIMEQLDAAGYSTDEDGNQEEYEADYDDEDEDEDEVDERSEESFPASDPPANY